MKAKAKTNNFKPVTIEITLETKEELEAIAKIFNYIPFLTALESIGLPCAEKVSDAAREAGGNTSTEWDSFEVKMKEYFK